MAKQLYTLRDTDSTASGFAPSLAPSYTTTDGYELESLDDHGAFAPGATSTTSLNPPDSEIGEPPAYSASAAFRPTVQLQIQTPGKATLSLPGRPRPDPIPVFAVDGSGSADPAYVCVRPSRNSGSCYMVAGPPPQEDGQSAAAAAPRPLSTTAYRLGPGRRPHVRLLADNLFPPSSSSQPDGEAGPSSSARNNEEGSRSRERRYATAEEIAEAADDESGSSNPAWDAFEVEPCGVLTRAQRFTSRLGIFEWRYAAKAERKAAGGADSLLVLDRIVRVVGARNGSGVQDEEVRTPVARFVRSEELRSPGSTSRSAGNGGRLLVDLSLWEGADNGSAAGKLDREMALVMAVTTALVMLKKEIDRRRLQQMAVMGVLLGGGSN